MVSRTTFALLGCLLLAMARVAPAQPADRPQATRLEAHMRFLADDLLEGREAGTRGHEIAARYVAAQFALAGLAPAGDDGGYLQHVPLRGATAQRGTAVLTLLQPGGEQPLAELRDFLMGPRLASEQADVSAPLVFVGWGITAPRYGHDDYAGLDVRGKIVAYLDGRPRHFPTEEGAHYASGRTKGRLAASHGAVGVIALQTPEQEALFPFARSALMSGQQSIDWMGADGRLSREVPGLQGGAYVSVAAVPRFFAEAGLVADEVFAAAAAGRPLPRGDLKLSARMAQASRHTQLTSANVAALIEGSDPRLKNEVVVVTAHLDHLGVRPSMTGDTIMNGAMDNAAGVAAMLEMARLVAAQPVKPRRTLAFVAVTGEEKGFVGSSYFASRFASRPPRPGMALVANVNVDMPVLLHDFSEAVAIGAERSTLIAPARRAAAQAGLTLAPDPLPEQGRFTRSDHYSFVQMGIPSVFLKTGDGSFNAAEDGRRLTMGFMRDHYHRASDDMRLPFLWRAAERFAWLNLLLGLEIANDARRPRWNDGDLFGELFGSAAPMPR